MGEFFINVILFTIIEFIVLIIKKIFLLFKFIIVGIVKLLRRNRF